MENQIDDFFRNRLSGAEVCPDPGLWNQIGAAMVRRKQRRIRIYSTAAMLVFAVAALFLLWNFPSQTKPESAFIADHDSGAAVHGPTRNEVTLQKPVKPQTPSKVSASDVYRRADRKAMALIDHQAVENISYLVQDPIEQINETVAAEVVLQDVSEVNNSASDVIVFELMSAEEIMPQMVRQPKIFKSVMGLKRDGITLGVIHDFKNEIFNRLNRNRQRIEETETKFITTEQ